MLLAILTVAIAHEQDIVTARRRARQIARLLKFPDQDGTRIATAVSEIARNAYAYGKGGKVEFSVDAAPPQSLSIQIVDQGPGFSDVERVLSGAYRSSTGMGLGIVGARRLMDGFQIDSVPGKGARITLRKALPAALPGVTKKTLAALAGQLAQEPQEIYDEIRHQNQELLGALDDLRRREEDLSRINRELEDTNRGVVALYAELDQRAEQLRHADRTKSRFLSHMSHEFRTPLNAVVGLTRLLLKREGVAQSPEAAKEFSLIQQTVLSLMEMVDDLLDLAKAESGKLTVRTSDFDVPTLFSTLRAMMRPLAVNNAVELIFEDPAAVPPMVSDDNKISQILRNLLSNALKFTERGEVRVAAHYLPERDSVLFSVADTGIGIAPQDLDRIFEEFAQIDHSLQRKIKGTGLGLPLCKKLAELLGGSVRVESEPGAGSRFTALIPRIYSHAPKQQEQEGLDRRRTIVVIDNEEVPRYLLRHLLAGRFQVVEASSGADGIEQARKLRPDLIFLDLNMPELSGFEVLSQLKSAVETRDIPVLVATGQNLNSETRERLAAQTAAVFSKDMLSGAESLSIDFGPPLAVSPRYACGSGD